MSVMIEGVVARGVVTGGHPAFQRAHSTTRVCATHLWTHLFAGLVRPVPPSNHSPTRRGERGDNERGDKVRNLDVPLL